jgi:hypothetical protein
MYSIESSFKNMEKGQLVGAPFLRGPNLPLRHSGANCCSQLSTSPHRHGGPEGKRTAVFLCFVFIFLLIFPPLELAVSHTHKSPLKIIQNKKCERQKGRSYSAIEKYFTFNVEPNFRIRQITSPLNIFIKKKGGLNQSKPFFII